MSLLNQMLKDLEQRNARAVEVKPLAGEVRSVASPTRSVQPMWLWVAIVCLSLLSTAFAIAWYKSTPKRTVEAVPLPAGTASAQPAPPPPVAQPIVEMAKEEEKQPEPEPSKTPAAQPAETKSTAIEAPPMGEKPQPQVAVSPIKDRANPKPAASIPVKQVSPQQRSDNAYRQAVGMLQQGRVVEAQAQLEQALANNPANHNARQLLAGLLLDNKRNSEAMALLQEGVRLAPEQSGFAMALARLQVEAGDTDSGVQTMQNGLSYAADDGEYQGFYAALLQRAERHDDAVTHYLAALRTDPANTSWLIGIGISLQALAKFADAREAFERARQVGKLSPELSRFVDQRLAQLARQTK